MGVRAGAGGRGAARTGAGVRPLPIAQAPARLRRHRARPARVRRQQDLARRAVHDDGRGGRRRAAVPVALVLAQAAGRDPRRRAVGVRAAARARRGAGRAAEQLPQAPARHRAGLPAARRGRNRALDLRPGRLRARRLAAAPADLDDVGRAGRDRVRRRRRRAHADQPGRLRNRRARRRRSKKGVSGVGSRVSGYISDTRHPTPTLRGHLRRSTAAVARSAPPPAH